MTGKEAKQGGAMAILITMLLGVVAVAGTTLIDNTKIIVKLQTREEVILEKLKSIDKKIDRLITPNDRR